MLPSLKWSPRPMSPSTSRLPSPGHPLGTSDALVQKTGLILHPSPTCSYSRMFGFSQRHHSPSLSQVRSLGVIPGLSLPPSTQLSRHCPVCSLSFLSRDGSHVPASVGNTIMHGAVSLPHLICLRSLSILTPRPSSVLPALV